MKNLPPKKQPGQGTGSRTMNGAALDLRTAAGLLGSTDKTLRGLVARRLVPFRRLGGRIIFLRSELDDWLRNLDGCTLEEAQQNQEARQ